MKVVVNRCHGGFGLSNAAMKLYVQKKIESTEGCYMGDGIVGEHGWSEKNFNEYLGDGFWGQRGSCGVVMWPHGGGHLYAGDHDIDDRDDPDLVAVVERMGDAASNSLSKLEVVVIPDGTDYQIEEYDGLEWVAEKHRTWR